ncbi:monofunctional biosynthetic peptidoglycan transglycosylase [Crenobacter luteus]|uniref:monofunctional biosynthetic peptidoglycan transglycosylase n=1 Tax=Crenobacter luteus TaxID=1452487 RepID=UPI00104AA3AC|nr:monofunctional biosynthetic peptidoglycan transglycosylase [Crenobacter luteus]TCP10981.1 monofunctional biosynthetic peptidoglycan transglycosylase [Crenobacter luteus]
MRLLLKIGAALLAAFVLYNLWIFGHIVYWRANNPSASTFMNEQLARLQENDPEAELHHKWVPYERISANLKRAIVASEDAKFVDHVGFDWDGIEAAFEKNMQKGRIVAGGSTISQQLAKNLFLSSRKTPWRKLEEAAITVMLEAVMDKRRIFEIYLNVIEWGNGVFGAEAASRHYFRVSAARLSPAQAARLAAMVPNPRYYDEHRAAPGLAKKTRIIVRRMRYADVP